MSAACALYFVLCSDSALKPFNSSTSRNRFSFAHKRECRRVFSVRRFVFRCLPGLEMVFRIMGATEGSFDECVQLLQDGNILSISPGVACVADIVFKQLVL